VTHRLKLRDELVSILRMLGGVPAPTRADLPAPAPEPVIDPAPPAPATPA
ncbi:acetyl-CoA carboxylase carboxyl transferase subunit beta, partial [Paracoccus liaowanqingii]